MATREQMTIAEQIATALKTGDEKCRVGGSIVFKAKAETPTHQLFLGGELVGAYYPEFERAMFFRVNSRVKSVVIQQIKRYI